MRRQFVGVRRDTQLRMQRAYGEFTCNWAALHAEYAYFDVYINKYVFTTINSCAVLKLQNIASYSSSVAASYLWCNGHAQGYQFPP